MSIHRSGLVVLALLSIAFASPAAAAKKGPSGTFRGESGRVTLAYQGEGMVSVDLETRYCRLKTDAGATFQFPHGVHVTDADGAPLLVIFYEPDRVIVYGELPAFQKAHCEGGHDATGAYRRAAATKARPRSTPKPGEGER